MTVNEYNLAVATKVKAFKSIPDSFLTNVGKGVAWRVEESSGLNYPSELIAVGHSENRLNVLQLAVRNRHIANPNLEHLVIESIEERDSGAYYLVDLLATNGKIEKLKLLPYEVGGSATYTPPRTEPEGGDS